MFSLLAVDVAQVGERARGTPPVTGVPKGRKGLQIQLAGSAQVALFAGDVALLIDRPSGATAITELLKDFRGFTQGQVGAGIITANLEHIGEVVKAPRDCRAVGQNAPRGETALEIGFRGGVVPPIPLRDSQSIQGRGNPPLISEFLIKRKAELEEMLRGGKIPLSSQ